MEFLIAFIPAYLDLHARFQREIVLGGDDVVDKHDAFAQQHLQFGAAGLRHFSCQELHQFHRFSDQVVRILGTGPCGYSFFCHGNFSL